MSRTTCSRIGHGAQPSLDIY